jgi:hypothetical protein
MTYHLHKNVAGSRDISIAQKILLDPVTYYLRKNVAGYHDISPTQKNVAGYHDISLT